MYYLRKNDNYDENSPLWIYEEWEYSRMAILGNDDLRSFVPDWISAAWGGIDDLAEGIEDIDAGYGWEGYETVSAMFNSMIPRANGLKYSTKTVHELRQAIAFYIENGYRNDDRIDVLCTILSAIRDEEYTHYSLYGCCQGDFNYLIAPARTDRDIIEQIECEYFQTGDSYRGVWIDDEEIENGLCADDIDWDNYDEWIYIPYSGDDSKVIKRIAAYVGAAETMFTIVG